MNEFTKSYKSLQGSIIRTLIYTFGHILIAMCIVSYMTGANLLEAGAVALLEPAINSLWFFVLDRLWSQHNE